MGVGKGELDLADATKAMDTRDNASSIVLEPVAQGDQFVEAAGEFLVIGRDVSLAFGRLANVLGVVAQVSGQ